MKHPGNIAMRQLLKEKYEQHHWDLCGHRKQQRLKHQTTAAVPAARNSGTSRRPILHLKTRIASEVVQEIKQGFGRFLKEVEVAGDGQYAAGSGLMVVVDDKSALQKIKIALRDLQKKSKQQL